MGKQSDMDAYQAIVSKRDTRSFTSEPVSEDDLNGKPAEFAMPKRLVQLAFEADRSFTY